MQSPPFSVTKELNGWLLYWAHLEMTEGKEASLPGVLATSARKARARFELQTLSTNPTVASLRKLFKEAGCDPTRYRPSSEALLRRVLKGDPIPSIHPLVDLNNCLSAEMAIPCCVMTEGTFEGPIHFRSGREGEAYESLRGPFNLAGKPLLLDAIGPLDAPITGSQRVKVTEETTRAWLVAYLPAEVLTAQQVDETLREILKAAPVASLLFSAES